LGAIGVASPGTGKEDCAADDGVVGFVEAASSEAGRLVEGVSGRAIGVSGDVVVSGSNSSISTSTSCWIVGSSTASADNSTFCFLLLRARLAGHGRSDLESQGSY